MKKVLIGCFLLFSVVLAQALPVLYDPRIKSPKPNFSLEETQQVNKDLVYLEKNAWSKELKQLTDSCGALPSSRDLIGRVSGSFLKVKTKEVLYGVSVRGCSDGGSLASIVLTYRDQRLIQAFQVIPPYESTPFCGLDALFSIKDINLNNFSELGLTWGCGENGSSVIRLEIMEFAPKNASVIFRHDVEEVSGDEINPKHVAYVLHVIKGKIPQVIGQQLSWIEKTQTWIPTDKLEVLKSDTDQMFVISPLLK